MKAIFKLPLMVKDMKAIHELPLMMGPNRNNTAGYWIIQEGCYIGAAESKGYTPKCANLRIMI